MGAGPAAARRNTTVAAQNYGLGEGPSTASPDAISCSVLAGQAGHSLHAYATNGLGLGGDGKGREQRFANRMCDLQHFVAAVRERPSVTILRARIAMAHEGAA